MRLWLACVLALALHVCSAVPLFAQAVDVVVSPAAQTVNVGDPVSVQIRINTNALSVCFGGVFVGFDTARLSFVSGANNTGTWNSNIFNVEPAENQAGIISLNVGANSPASGNDILVTTLNFTAIGSGTAALTLLANPGRELTQFFGSDCVTEVTTNRTGGSVNIQGSTNTPTATPTTAPTPTATGKPVSCVGDCDSSGSVTVDEIITLVNIALETVDPSACTNGVPAGSPVTISVIIEAVNNALRGCG